MSVNYKQLYAIKAKNTKRLLEVNPNLNNNSGIYFLTRVDEKGFKFAYVGQALRIKDRLLSHMTGYQHIDLSLKKHGFYSTENPYGWKIGFMSFSKEQLDEKEQYFIKLYADNGYQLRNKTSGSQGEGKTQIDEYRPAKGYRDGIKQGRKNLARELSDIIEKHLDITIKAEKQNNKVSQKMYDKFNELLQEGSNTES